MTSRAVHFPIVGRRYLVTDGPLKGRLVAVREIKGIGNTSPDVRCVLCDGWGGPTEREAVIKLSQMEV